MKVADIRDVAKLGEASSAPAEKPLTPRERVLNVTYESPEGEIRCAVTSRVLDGDEKLQIERAAAIMAGVSWSQLPPGAAARVYATAHVSVQLRDIPDNLARWITQDDELLFVLHAQCQEHLDSYFHPDAGEGSEAQGNQRVVISVASVASASAI